MPTATVQVMYVNAAKPPRKRHTIKDSKSQLWGLENPALLTVFKPGATYNVEYEISHYQGAEYRNISSATLVDTGPAPNGAAGGGTYRETSEKDSARMWKTAVLRAFIQQGQVQLSAEGIVAAVREIEIAYKNTYGKLAAGATTQPAKPSPAPAPQPAHDDMNDEIPF
jgi:hypothetical protein